MINYFAESLSSYFVENEIIPAEDKNIYKYGTEIAISSVLGLMIIFLLSVILGRIQDCILFLICFIPIKIYAGGYHMNTYLKCNATFVSVFLLILTISSVLSNFYISVALMFASLIIIIIFSPIENKYKPLSLKEQKKYRKISIVISVLWTVISFILFILDINILPLVSLTMFSIAVFMIVEKINKTKVGSIYHEQ